MSLRKRAYEGTNVWQTQEAKAKFSEVVRLAEAGDTQIITRFGEPIVYIIKCDLLNKKPKKKKNIFYNSELADIPLDLKRDKSPLRKDIKW